MIGELERLSRDFGWHISSIAKEENGVWCLPSAVPVHYPDEGRAVCAGAEEKSPWFQHRNQVLARLFQRTGGLPPALWEIGSGNGWVAAFFQQRGVDVVAVEPDAGGARLAVQRGVCSVCGTLEQLKLPASSIPSVGCFDVIEHLADPEPLLREIFRVLRPGSRVALSVPAFQALWSQTDEVSGHFRRYSRRSLCELMGRLGFLRLHSEYMMCSLVPPLIVSRVLPDRLGRRVVPDACMKECGRQLVPSSQLVRGLLTSALSLEYHVSGFLPLPWGTSLVGVFAKPAS